MMVKITMMVRRMTRPNEGHSITWNSLYTPAKNLSKSFSWLTDMPPPIWKMLSSSACAGVSCGLPSISACASAACSSIVSPVSVDKVGRTGGGRILSSGRSSSGRSELVFFGSYLAILMLGHRGR